MSARRIDRILARSGRLWQEDYFDRYIRDAEHLEMALRYVEYNPVRAGLCAEPEDWRLGSARRRAAEVNDLWAT